MDYNQQPTRAERAERVMQNVANLATIVGSVVALLSDQLVWLLPSVIAIAFLFFALRHGRLAAAFVSTVVIAVAVFVGVSSYMNVNVGWPPLIPGTPTAQATTTSHSPIPDTVTTEPKEDNNNTPNKVFDGEVTLERYDSVDVDVSPAKIAHDQDGAVGEGDLFLDPTSFPGALYAHGSATVYLVSLGTNNPDQAYAACSSSRNASPFGFVSKGSAICFKTSEGRMTWAAIGAVHQPTLADPATSVTLRVIVWDE